MTHVRWFRGSGLKSIYGSGTRSNSSYANTGISTGDGKNVKCNYCSKINNGGIFRFKHHLAGTKWDSEPCASVPEEVKMLMMKIVVEVANTSEKRRKLDKEEEDRTKAPSIIPFNDSMVARGVPAMAAVAIAALDLTGSSNWWRDINRSPLWQD
ncbi:hypothetical protein JHK87_022464 [Glycine soja]|nr:hypothetical protein JHK87_022464 [Glycine soja]